jgi:hypothetical protein
MSRSIRDEECSEIAVEIMVMRAAMSLWFRNAPGWAIVNRSSSTASSFDDAPQRHHGRFLAVRRSVTW